jgi:phosphopantothenoylcysteine decarboxylase/phosphopantothenate--cysteine ligase
VFTTSADLSRRLEGLGSSEVGAVFHAAAVCDFAFGKIWRRAAGGKLSEIKSRKISTRRGTLLAELTPAPKILRRLRGWFPKARLVGWKYELEGDRTRVITLAERQLEENQTDACVVNGLAYGMGYGLVQGPGRCRHLPEKRALFEALDDLIEQGKKE